MCCFRVRLLRVSPLCLQFFPLCFLVSSHSYVILNLLEEGGSRDIGLVQSHRQVFRKKEEKFMSKDNSFFDLCVGVFTHCYW